MMTQLWTEPAKVLSTLIGTVPTWTTSGTTRGSALRRGRGPSEIRPSLEVVALQCGRGEVCAEVRESSQRFRGPGGRAIFGAGLADVGLGSAGLRQSSADAGPGPEREGVLGSRDAASRPGSGAWGRSGSGRARSVVEFTSSSVEVDPTLVAEFIPDAAGFTLNSVGPNLADIIPNHLEVRPGLATHDQNWPVSVKASLASFKAELAEAGPNLAEFGPKLVSPARFEGNANFKGPRRSGCLHRPDFC